MKCGPDEGLKWSEYGTVRAVCCQKGALGKLLSRQLNAYMKSKKGSHLA